jgi:hypothetical protein
MNTPHTDLRSAAVQRGWMPSDTPETTRHAERRGASASALMQRRISGLAGQAYEDAPATVRAQLLEKLLRPMSPYTLISVAGGVFAQIKGRNAEWQGFRVRDEDIGNVNGHDVAALVDRVQQLNGDAVDGLARVMEASPALADSAAASALIALVQQQRRKRWAGFLGGQGIGTPARLSSQQEE